ncbi:hypothetical protein ACFL5U_02005 [Candidatus Margulisiibacteriota bacterium]
MSGSFDACVEYIKPATSFLPGIRNSVVPFPLSENGDRGNVSIRVIDRGRGTNHNYGFHLKSRDVEGQGPRKCYSADLIKDGKKQAIFIDYLSGDVYVWKEGAEGKQVTDAGWHLSQTERDDLRVSVSTVRGDAKNLATCLKHGGPPKLDPPKPKSDPPKADPGDHYTNKNGPSGKTPQGKKGKNGGWGRAPGSREQAVADASVCFNPQAPGCL